MSKSKNVNPGHYKTRGSLRQGEDVVHDEEREKLGRDKARLEAAEPPQTSSKTGKTSSAKKQSIRRGFEPASGSRPVAGASGKEEKSRRGAPQENRRPKAAKAGREKKNSGAPGEESPSASQKRNSAPIPPLAERRS
jgi:hypothetical protein